VFKPHSICAASSTNAVEKSIRVNKVKKHASWSLAANTFEKYHFKPNSQQNDSTRIANSIFFSSKGEHTSL
ncbi:hypothetical protein BD770DRAFT_320046, partial [Pilaira anomala]